ncbi:MAG: hypothetical protein AB8B80_04675 [Marinicellaceae bacterium]
MKVILGKASANSNNEKYPKGEIHALLMFVKTDSKDKAQQIAKVKTQNKGWNKLKLSRIGAVNIENFKPDDEEIKVAFDSAMQSGYGLLVYPDVENDMIM